MNSFHGEPIIQELVERTQMVLEEIEIFRDIFEYTLDKELEEEFDDIEENEESYTYHDEIAEAFFLGFSSKQLIRGYQAIYKNESGTERIEYWSAGPLVLIYNYTNRAVRRLTIKSNAVLSELLVQADAFREQKSEVADVTKYSPEGASAE